MSGDRDALATAGANAFASAFEAVIKLTPENGDPVWIDGRIDPPQTSSAALTGGENCSLFGAPETLLRALASQRGFESAYVSGRLSIAGDMSVLARLKFKETR